MGKPFDTRIVEYAYASNFVVLPNIFVEAVPAIIENGVEVSPAEPAKYKIRVTLTYELLDANRNRISEREVEHSIVTNTLQNVEQVQSLVTGNLKNFVAADKFELSGYVAP